MSGWGGWQNTTAHVNAALGSGSEVLLVEKRDQLCDIREAMLGDWDVCLLFCLSYGH